MSAGNPEGFPWGENCPTRNQRLLFALVIALASSAWWVEKFFSDPFDPQTPRLISDFDQVWLGATALLNGGDPYVLMGPGKVFHMDYPVLYPATAFVAAIPFAFLTQMGGTLAFIFVSTFLMAYGITADGWHRVPVFASLPFITSVWLGQWSMLFTAALFLPWVAVASAIKPQTALPIVAASSSRATPIAAVVGGLVLLAISLMYMPTWPLEWWRAIWSSPHMSAPVARLGGFAILLVLLRWRRPEAWLVLILACLPQTSYPYNVLVLLALANTWREAAILSVASTIGSVPELRVDIHELSRLRTMGDLMVISTFLPATIMILRRPNEGVGPWWMQLIRGLRQSPRGPAVDIRAPDVPRPIERSDG